MIAHLVLNNNQHSLTQVAIIVLIIFTVTFLASACCLTPYNTVPKSIKVPVTNRVIWITSTTNCGINNILFNWLAYLSLTTAVWKI